MPKYVNIAEIAAGDIIKASFYAVIHFLNIEDYVSLEFYDFNSLAIVPEPYIIYKDDYKGCVEKDRVNINIGDTFLELMTIFNNASNTGDDITKKCDAIAKQYMIDILNLHNENVLDYYLMVNKNKELSGEFFTGEKLHSTTQEDFLKLIAYMALCDALNSHSVESEKLSFRFNTANRLKNHKDKIIEFLIYPNDMIPAIMVKFKYDEKFYSANDFYWQLRKEFNKVAYELKERDEYE